MKRGIFTDKQRMLRKKAREEHELFKYKMLASPARHIYECCSEIRFYECIYEYFTYCDDAAGDIADGCLKEQNIIAALWQTYIQNEYLKYDTWDDITELITVMIHRREEIQN